MSIALPTDTVLVACQECDLVYPQRPLEPHHVARCRRCNAVVYRGPGAGIELSLALSVTAALLFVIANAYPLLSLELQGQAERTSLPGAVRALLGADMWGLALVVAVTSIVAPLLEILGMLYVLAPLRLGARAPGAVTLFRWLEKVRPWGMVEVYLLGTLIAVFKLSSMATVEAGVALYAFAALVFATAGALVTLDEDAVWRGLDARRR